MNYHLKMDLRVWDPEQLFHRAVFMLVGEGMPLDEADAELRDEEGEIDVEACLIQIVDPGSIPGCNIYGTDVESYGDPALESEPEPD